MRRILIGLVFLAAVAAGVYGLSHFTKWRKPSRPAVPAGTMAPSKDEMIRPVFFPNKEGTELVEEKRIVPRTGSASAGIAFLLTELHKGPAGEGLRPIFPPDTFPRTVFLSADGTLYINYNPKVLEAPLGPHDEIMLLRSIAKSLIYNYTEVSALVILADGAPRHNLGLHMPAHGRYILPQVLFKSK